MMFSDVGPRTSKPHLLVLIPLLLIGTACEDSPTGETPLTESDLLPGNTLWSAAIPITLNAQPGFHLPGDEIQLELENGLTGGIGYNLCFHAIEVPEEDAWHPVDLDRICTLELHVLPPLETVTYDATLPEDLTPGVYRFRAAIHRLATGEIRDVVSNSFSVPDGGG